MASGDFIKEKRLSCLYSRSKKCATCLLVLNHGTKTDYNCESVLNFELMNEIRCDKFHS